MSITVILKKLSSSLPFMTYLSMLILSVIGIRLPEAIQAVTENGPAAQAGLQRGDVITAVDGKAMNSIELVSFVGGASVGQQVVFSIYRQGEMLEITVDVGEQIQSALEQTQDQQAQQSYPDNFPWGRP